MPKKRSRVFSRAFKLAAVRRMMAGEDVSALSRELQVLRKDLYYWRTRFRAGGRTEREPACMLPIVDRPLIQHLVEGLAARGLCDIAFVVSDGAEAIDHPRLPPTLRAVRGVNNPVFAGQRPFSTSALLDIMEPPGELWGFRQFGRVTYAYCSVRIAGEFAATWNFASRRKG